MKRAVVPILILAAYLLGTTQGVTRVSALGLQQLGVYSERIDASMLAAMQGANVRAVVLNLEWLYVEPTVSSGYSWGFMDSRVLAMAGDARQVELIVTGCPDWACTLNHPNGPLLGQYTQAFVSFVTAAARRYYEPPYNVRTFFIFNEEDLSYPQARWQEYGPLYDSTRVAVGQVQPLVSVIPGGLAYEYGSKGFLPANAAWFGNAPALAFHWYPPQQYGTEFPTLTAKANAIRAVINKPLVLNEVGSDSQFGGGTEALQAQRLTQYTQEARAQGIPIRWFMFSDWGDGVGDPGFQHAGIVRTDGTPKSAYNAYAAMQQTFTDVPPGSTYYAYVEYLAARGIVGGYPDGTFRPNDGVTRGQAAKMIALSMQWQGSR